ncbi:MULTISPECIES: TetR/AcrR family transcriptional regulator [Streptomyces]|jgi:AcrR family transcriptional regulator|uniref:TetR/AcrR family transcriptional regulator n=1 Tax=Streptomyces spinosisporus TaxID=2927582 RepID=A0ABS9XU22_9ACTN|nr:MULTISPECIES: TetR/AcrR family transcriptional regulator [Streptomyces]MCI3245567.1 TetR/AcrR family transcriptional regulator [Streptomyces spinosisporus]WUB35734.1 TetR/AcrR family transcriptional regulator [Streptomyces sp. NBC_00588]
MGHREDLLEGAKRCLLQKGFLRTTARDVVKESGTNLASIGYHYGSKDALLAQAYLALVEEMSFGGEAGIGGAPGSLERFREVWSNIVDSMRRPGSLWRLSLEIVTMGDQLPEVRDQLSRAQREGGRGLVSLMTSVPEEEISDETADTLGRFYMTLMSGLISQWTFDPKTAPDADTLTEGLRQIVEGITEN